MTNLKSTHYTAVRVICGLGEFEEFMKEHPDLEVRVNLIAKLPDDTYKPFDLKPTGYVDKFNNFRAGPFGEWMDYEGAEWTPLYALKLSE